MLKSVICLIALIHLLVDCSALPAWAQERPKSAEQDQTLKLKTDLFEVRAVVTDKHGLLIDNLKREDFELLENGRPQNIGFFSKESLPPQAAAGTPPARPPLTESKPARTVALFVDTLHLSAESQLRIQQTLRQFIQEQLTDDDLAAIILSGGQMGLFNQFTRDRRLLLYAVDTLAIGGQAIQSTTFTPYIATAVDRGDPEAIAAGIEIIREEEFLDLPPLVARRYVEARARSVLQETAHWRKLLLATLKETVKRMAGYPGQRIITFISDGFSLSDRGIVDTGELNQVIRRANASGIVIYSISAKGLVPPAMFDASNRFPPSSQLTSYLSASEKELRDGMNALANDTGGKAFFNSNDLKGLLKRALDDNRLYYALAYYPPNPHEGKDKVRKITVRVKNHPEYEVRTQKSFVASDLRPEAEAASKSPQHKLVEAILGPLPVTSVGVAASANFLESDLDDRQTTIRVDIDANTLEYKQKNDQYQVDLEVAILIFNRSGKLAKEATNTIHGDLTAERLAMARRSGLRQTTRVALSPGVYQVRVGVRDLGTERLGTAMALLEIPDLTRNQLALSDLFIGEIKTGGEKPSGKAASLEIFNPNVNRGLPVFQAGRNLACSFMAYNVRPDEAGQETRMQVAIFHRSEAVYQGDWKPLRMNLVGQDKKGLLIGSQIKVALEPGLYELRVTVQVRGSKKSIQRSALFEVVA